MIEVVLQLRARCPLKLSSYPPIEIGWWEDTFLDHISKGMAPMSLIKSLGCKIGKILLQRFYASEEQQTIYIFKFSDVSALKIERARTTVDKVHPDSLGGRMSGAWRQEEACLKFRLREVNVKAPSWFRCNIVQRLAIIAIIADGRGVGVADHTRFPDPGCSSTDPLPSHMVTCRGSFCP